MADPEPFRQPHLLLVEGRQDQRFLTAMLAARGRSDVEVRQTGGTYGLTTDLATIVRTSGFRQVRWLGIMHDADDDPQAAFDRIRTALRATSLSTPPHSWVVTGSDPAVAAIILPDGTSTGDLETLVLQSLAGNAVAGCVDDYIRCLSAQARAPRRESKSRMQTFLASLDRPDLRLGEAAERGLLPLSSPDLDRLVALLPAPSIDQSG